MSIKLPLCVLPAGELLQHVSRVVYRDKPLYYGRGGTNRYDAPNGDYGVLYLGPDLPTALMESVFHKHQWLTDTKRSIALAEVRRRLVRAVGVLDALHLADLTADGVMAGYFGLNLEQLASRDYTYTQQVSDQVHGLSGSGAPLQFDGVRYPSRNNYPAASIALFERAASKIKVMADIDLVDHAGWPDFVAKYGIGIEPDPGPAAPDPGAP
ncbi:RES family NAD+ phosphorylase [Pseudomonas protegens]|uniref:RES family NAD+ phosphorylase n=1 Tax=Pseudomonas protegens TaxID=380021 RepID=UPI001F45D241|nr:RES family NAD+ phosphorylase [Pseudomonas protegens]